MSLLRRAIPATLRERRGANPYLDWGSSAIPTNGMMGLPGAGITITEDTAMAVNIVYTCVGALVDDVSTLPLETFRAATDRTQIRTDPPPLLQNPWIDDGVGSLMSWIGQYVASTAFRGNFVGRVTDRDRDGYPTQIQPLHMDEVMIRWRDPMAKRGREYRHMGQIIPLGDVFHIPGKHLMPGGLGSLDPLTYMRHSWGLTASAEQYGGAFFRNSAEPGGVIEVPGDLDDDETLALARQWSMTHQGISGSSLPGVLTGGMKWVPYSITHENMQFLETRQFQRAEVAAGFGIPPRRLGIQDRTPQATDPESEAVMYTNDTLIGYFRRLEVALSQPSVTPPSISCRFRLDERMRANIVARYQAHQIGRNIGVLNGDEIRQAERLPDMPEGQGKVFFMPLNFAPIAKIIDGTAGIKATPDGPGAGGVPDGAGGMGGGIDSHPDAPGGGMKPALGDGSP